MKVTFAKKTILRRPRAASPHKYSAFFTHEREVAGYYQHTHNARFDRSSSTEYSARLVPPSSLSMERELECS
jgi:hypothetical protein